MFRQSSPHWSDCPGELEAPLQDSPRTGLVFFDNMKGFSFRITLRLSSFKAPRDLSLGSPKSAEKKKFVPNFNVARVKREPEESKVVVKKEGAGAKQKKRQEQKKEKKDKKERPELIQTMGSVFSEVIVTRRGRIGSH